MTLRYQKQSLYAERKGVKTHEGIDPVTGLPVLIYEFTAKPRPNLKILESENIPGFLEVAEGNTNHIIVAYSKNYKSISKPMRVGKVTLLLDSARALKDAAAAKVIHGDIRPERFLATHEHVLLEGFGIPWDARENPFRAPETKEANLKDDVYAWAKSVLDLVEGDLPDSFMNILQQCLVAHPADRPAAEALYTALSDLVNGPKTKGISELSDLEIEVKTPPQGEKAFAASSPPPTPIPPPKAEQKVDPELKKSFVKDLPPGATYRPGETIISKQVAELKADISDDPLTERATLRRRSLLIGAFIVAVLLLAGLALFNQFFPRNTLPQAASSNLNQYIVELEIGPANLPPVELVVISSPPGSNIAPNTLLGSNYSPGTRRIVLDQEGVWQLQGRFGQSQSEIVTLTLPQDRQATIEVLPPEEEAEGE